MDARPEGTAQASVSRGRRVAATVLGLVFAAGALGGLFGAGLVIGWFDQDSGGIHRVHDLGSMVFHDFAGTGLPYPGGEGMWWGLLAAVGGLAFVAVSEAVARRRSAP